MSQKTLRAKKRPSHVYEGKYEWLFQAVLIFIVLLLSITFFYPYWHVVVTSISSVDTAESAGFKLWPSKVSFDAYRQMFMTKSLWTGYKNTLIVVLMGWTTSITLNILGAYSLSKKDLPCRNLFTTIIILTMFLQGGMIPTYLLVSQTLGMRNTYWAVILPQCVSVSHLVIMRNYFMNLPGELEEAAIIDGANSFQVLIRIMLPLSITPHTHFVGQVYVLSKEEGGRHTPFFKGYRPQFYIRTTDVTGDITLPEGVEMVMPGDNVSLEVQLIQPVAMEDKMRFAIREGGHTVGAGTVSKIIA